MGSRARPLEASKSDVSVTMALMERAPLMHMSMVTFGTGSGVISVGDLRKGIGQMGPRTPQGGVHNLARSGPTELGFRWNSVPLARRHAIESFFLRSRPAMLGSARQAPDAVNFSLRYQTKPAGSNPTSVMLMPVPSVVRLPLRVSVPTSPPLIAPQHNLPRAPT